MYKMYKMYKVVTLLFYLLIASKTARFYITHASNSSTDKVVYREHRPCSFQFINQNKLLIVFYIELYLQLKVQVKFCQRDLTNYLINWKNLLYCAFSFFLCLFFLEGDRKFNGHKNIVYKMKLYDY